MPPTDKRRHKKKHYVMLEAESQGFILATWYRAQA